MIYVLGVVLLMIGGVVYWATRPEPKIETEIETENDTN